MAVAVKTKPENATQAEPGSLASASLLGTLYVVAALVILTTGVPLVWSKGLASWVTEYLGSFVSGAGLIVVELFVLAILAYVGFMLTGGTPRPGLKGGVATVVGILLGVLILGSLFAGGAFATQVLGVILIAAALFFGFRFVFGPAFDGWAKQFEAQGWFNVAPYKPSQGRLVRRCTMIGIIGLAAAGVWTLMNHHTLDSMGKDWVLALPFIAHGVPTITLLPDIRITLPIIIAAAAFWLGYRVVHMPTFAEFLIATEGELNKIAWPTRKSLIQDTIVVLTTVVLFTLFLFFVDIAWGKILSNPYVGVLRLDTKSTTKPVEDIKDLEW